MTAPLTAPRPKVACVECGSESGPWGRTIRGLTCEVCLGDPPLPAALSDLERARTCAVALESENWLLRRLLAELLGVDGDLDVELLVAQVRQVLA